MFIDGLWLSGMTVHIHRDGMPIPKNMQDSYIKLTLSPTQVAAISAVLGIGMRGGDVLCYTDEFLNKAMLDNSDETMKDSYRIITTDMSDVRRVAKTVFNPVTSNRAISNAVIKNDSGEFSWDSDALKNCFIDIDESGGDSRDDADLENAADVYSGSNDAGDEADQLEKDYVPAKKSEDDDVSTLEDATTVYNAFKE